MIFCSTKRIRPAFFFSSNSDGEVGARVCSGVGGRGGEGEREKEVEFRNKVEFSEGGVCMIVPPSSQSHR